MHSFGLLLQTIQAALHSPLPAQHSLQSKLPRRTHTVTLRRAHADEKQCRNASAISPTKCGKNTRVSVQVVTNGRQNVQSVKLEHMSPWRIKGPTTCKPISPQQSCCLPACLSAAAPPLSTLSLSPHTRTHVSCCVLVEVSYSVARIIFLFLCFVNAGSSRFASHFN